MEHKTVIHEFEPVYDADSKILILGSLPSVKSREMNFYYGHPQNRFWRVISAIAGEPVPQSVPEKRKLLLDCHIAVWDVIASCDIAGSSDASIKNVVPTDISSVLSAAQISAVFTNGGTASRIYRKYQLPLTGITDIPLPSTSPANAAWTLERLTEEWRSSISLYL